MSIVAAIWRRELQAYFVSPIAYTVVAICLLIAGFGFLAELTAYSKIPEFRIESSGLNIRNFVMANLTGIWFTLGLIVALPALSMRLFSEERKTGTAELLMTSPVTTGQLVLGKYLGAVSVLALILALSTPYVAILMWKGNPEMAAIGTTYLGYLLFGGVILAIGLFASALTENQIVALLITWAVFLPMYLFELLVGFVGSPWDDILRALTVGNALRSFGQGLVDTHYLVLDGALIFGFLFLCAQVIDSNRWR